MISGKLLHKCVVSNPTTRRVENVTQTWSVTAFKDRQDRICNDVFLDVERQNDKYFLPYSPENIMPNSFVMILTTSGSLTYLRSSLKDKRSTLSSLEAQARVFIFAFYTDTQNIKSGSCASLSFNCYQESTKLQMLFTLRSLFTDIAISRECRGVRVLSID